MFYVNYIHFKNDTVKTRQVALLVSVMAIILLIYLVKISVLNFIIGKHLEIYEYLYILILIYLLINVFIAYKLDGTEAETNKIEENEELSKVNASESNPAITVKPGVIVDDFIFNKITEYNIKTERCSIIPDYGKAGLEAPEEEGSDNEAKVSNDDDEEPKSLNEPNKPKDEENEEEEEDTNDFPKEVSKETSSTVVPNVEIEHKTTVDKIAENEMSYENHRDIDFNPEDQTGENSSEEIIGKEGATENSFENKRAKQARLKEELLRKESFG